MSAVETRHVSRDSLFLLADVRLEADPAVHRVKVRNLSPGGMMGEGAVRVQRGTRLTIALRNVGEVTGSVAWVQDDRFGVAFDSEVDARAARTPTGADGTQGRRFARPRIAPHDLDTGPLRKL